VNQETVTAPGEPTVGAATASLLIAEPTANAVLHGRVRAGTPASPPPPCGSRSPTRGASAGPCRLRPSIPTASPDGACSWSPHPRTSGAASRTRRAAPTEADSREEVAEPRPQRATDPLRDGRTPRLRPLLRRTPFTGRWGPGRPAGSGDGTRTRGNPGPRPVSACWGTAGPPGLRGPSAAVTAAPARARRESLFPHRTPTTFHYCDRSRIDAHHGGSQAGTRGRRKGPWS
jgi:hypothetical protein